VGLEVVERRAFASALDWPGWSRSGRDEASALAALVAAGARYAAVAAATGDAPAATGAAAASTPDPGSIVFTEIVERLPGTATTAFGAPDAVFALDRRPVDAVEAERLAVLVAASWQALDAAVASAPAVLRKGPRGGGRDRDEIVAHCVGADAAYARQVGLRVREPSAADRAAVAAVRATLLGILRLPSDGSPLGGRRWPVRYAARRIAWHALDHAWEIEDRASPD
jgi:hypothetical protein